MLTFEEALSTWNKAADEAVVAKTNHNRIHCAALLVADAKNADGRDAQATLAASGELQALKLAENRATSARLLVDYLIAKASVTP